MKIDTEICCVCGHKLPNHILEKGGWRCHALDETGYQCECWLRIREPYVMSLDWYDFWRRKVKRRHELLDEEKILKSRCERWLP